MTKLRLNQYDRERLGRDVEAFVYERYDSSPLGQERKALIDKVQHIATRILYEHITKEEMNTLLRIGCVKNEHNDFKYSCEVEKNFTETHGRISMTPWSSTANKFVRFRIVFPRISAEAPDNVPGKITEACYKEFGNRGVGLADELWRICDQMQCEADKITRQYQQQIDGFKSWEDMLESMPEMIKMVKLGTLLEIRESKEKKDVKLEMDPQVVLFGEEIIKEEKPANKKAKKGAKA
jgi:hypothetical protein